VKLAWDHEWSREHESHGLVLHDEVRTGNLMAFLIRVTQGFDVVLGVDATPIVPIDDCGTVSAFIFPVWQHGAKWNEQKVVWELTLLNLFTSSVFHMYGPSSKV
jgi:hypothetical protein